jgi:hypothetical protein
MGRPLSTHRICVERLPVDELMRPETRALLQRHGVAPIVAAPDAGDDGSADRAVLQAIAEYRRAGLDASGAWPLLARADGYWPSERDPARFGTRVEALLGRGPAPPWLLVDLEPPFSEMKALTGPARVPALIAKNLSPRRYRAARADFAALAGRLRDGGTRTLACATPLAGGDFLAGGSFWQDAFESPLLGVGWDAVGLMVYTTLLATRSGPLLDEPAARRFAFLAARATVRRFGDGAAALVGLVGGGVLEDEAEYDDPEQLRLDVAAVRAAGAGDVILYSLEGVLAKPRPERWLEALVQPQPLEPRSPRGDLVWGALAAVGALAAWYRP